MGDEKILIHLGGNDNFPLTLYWGRRDPAEWEYINVPATGEMNPSDARRLAHALLYAADRVEMRNKAVMRGELEPE